MDNNMFGNLFLVIGFGPAMIFFISAGLVFIFKKLKS